MTMMDESCILPWLLPLCGHEANLALRGQGCAHTADRGRLVRHGRGRHRRAGPLRQALEHSHRWL